MATIVASETYELQYISAAPNTAHTLNENHESHQASNAPETHDAEYSLPPHDKGRAAYTLLLAAFVFEALLWGFPLSFGVFQDYYSHLPQFQHNRYVTVIGTTASGISYLAAPIAIPLTKRYSRWRRQMIWVGCMCAHLST